MPRLLVKFPYAVYSEVTPVELDMLLNLTLFEKDGYGTDERFSPTKEDTLELFDIIYASEYKFLSTDTPVTDSEAILAENKRLTYENGILQAAYDTLANKTLLDGDN